MNNNIIKPIIFQTWRNKNFHRKIEKLRKGMVNSNPNFDFRLFSNEEMDSSIEEYFDYDIINSYFILKHYAARSDFWRYLMLKKFGGIYLDIDSLILKNLKPLYEINRSILTLEPTKTDFIQWVLIFNKDDEVLETCVEMIIQNIRNKKYKNDVMSLTGPTLFTNAIKKVLKLSSDFELDVSKNETLEKLNSSKYYYLPNIQHDEYFLFKHKYNHLLRERKKAFLKSYSPDQDHWSEFQKKNSIY